MGIASNKRYQLVRGLRRSLRMTPPFTGRVAREDDELKPGAPLNEVDRAPAPDPVKPVRMEPAAGKDVAATAGAPAVPAPVQDATAVEKVPPVEAATAPATSSSVESPTLSLFGPATQESEGPEVQLHAVEATRSSSAVTTPEPAPAAPEISPAAAVAASALTEAAPVPVVRPKRNSAWSFAAGLVLGVSGSSAAWSWVTNLQAAEPAPVHASVPLVSKNAPLLLAAAGPKKEEPASPAAAPEAKPAKAPAPSASEKKANGPAEAPAPAKEVPVAPLPPAAPVQEKPETETKPVPAPVAEPAPPAPPRAAPANDFDKWKSSQIAEIEAKFPELHPWVNSVQEGEWRNNGRIVNGTSVIKARTPAHTALIKWLNLEPPSDPDTRRAVHNVVIRLLSTEDCLALWEPLVKNGASNTQDIHNAADALLANREGKLSETDKARVKALIEASAPKEK